MPSRGDIYPPRSSQKGGGCTQRFCGSETLKVPFLVCQTIIAIYDDCCLQLYVYITSYIYGEERDRWLTVSECNVDCEKFWFFTKKLLS